jgi:hypothetical protein
MAKRKVKILFSLFSVARQSKGVRHLPDLCRTGFHRMVRSRLYL